MNQLLIPHVHTVLSDQELLRIHASEPILFSEDRVPLRLEKAKVNNGLFLSVSLGAADGEIVGYKAKKHRDMIDLEKIHNYSITDFWDPIRNGSDAHPNVDP